MRGRLSRTNTARQAETANSQFFLRTSQKLRQHVTSRLGCRKRSADLPYPEDESRFPGRDTDVLEKGLQATSSNGAETAVALFPARDIHGRGPPANPGPGGLRGLFRRRNESESEVVDSHAADRSCRNRGPCP